MSSRLQSLDILRGLTVAGMILVNNGYGESFQMLRHSVWNGLTPCDLVFPFFLFIMGISCYLSLSKSAFLRPFDSKRPEVERTPTATVVRRVLKRTVLLFVIGLFINWFELALKGAPLDLGHLRLWAVMQRIALCYFFVSMFALYVYRGRPHGGRLVIAAIVALLAVYTMIIVWGNGYSQDPEANILARADRALFGYDHLYHKSPVDPEGLLGTISATAHVLIGFLCGMLIKQRPALADKIIALFTVGTVCLILGYLLSFGLPLNKRIWSPSYALVTCGLAALLQALLISLFDRHPSCVPSVASDQRSSAPSSLHPSCVPSVASDQRSSAPFTNLLPPSSFLLPPVTALVSQLGKVFGMNALALYVGSELLSILFGHFGIATFIYDALHAVIAAPKWASLTYALIFVAINYLLGYCLYRRRIFIKL